MNYAAGSLLVQGLERKERDTLLCYCGSNYCPEGDTLLEVVAVLVVGL